MKNAIVHVYNSTSLSQREQVFRKSKEEILKIAVEGAKLLQQLTEEAGANYRFEYSPESFTGTEPEYALEVCNAVLDVWKPTAGQKGHHQSAGNSTAFHAACLCTADRICEQTPEIPRKRIGFPASA